MIETLYSLMAKVGITTHQDKVLHALVGFAIGLGISLLFQPLYAVMLVITAAIGKEAYDEYNYGSGDFFDLFTTLLGGWAGIFAYGILF